MFSLESFDIKLDTEFVGRNFIFTEEVESTNTVLLNRANKFNSDGTVVLAEKQSKGKGRKERTWYSAKGQNLTFSILLTSKKFLGKNFNLLNFASSLSVAFALENLFQLKPELKWPNDVLINGKKICGILMESTSQGSKIERVVIGIGLNVNQVIFQGSFNLEPTSIKLELGGESIDREKLLAELLNTFEETLARIPTEPQQIFKDWKDRCRLLGEKISIMEDGTTKYGIFDDIDNEGYLLLKTKNKIEKIHFGDVSAAK